jgi:hypothetical protein
VPSGAELADLGKHQCLHGDVGAPEHRQQCLDAVVTKWRLADGSPGADHQLPATSLQDRRYAEE